MPKVRKRFAKFVNVAEEHGFISSLVNIGQFQQNCNELLTQSEINFRKKGDFTTESVSEEMGVSKTAAKELEETCSASSLVCPREEEVLNWNESSCIPRGTGLVTLDNWKRITSARTTKSRLLKSKYTELSCSLYARASETPAKNDDDVIQCPELVITVSVDFPRGVRRNKANGVDFLVLGSQKLTELRDRIPCVLNEQPVGKFTENPDHPRDIRLKDICTSAFFFIESTFFNDSRNPESTDLSKIYMKWAESGETFIPSDAQGVSMDDYTFNDLNLRIGCPYIFLHQGDCEHVVVFKDIKLFSSSDCQSRSSYPLSVSRANLKASPCQLCSLFLSTWVTYSSDLAVANPAFYCERCFKTLHFDKQGNKLGDFKAYPQVRFHELDY